MNTIQYALLGFLSWRPATGYDLKKLIADSAFHYWSGNNNQIYRSLVELHREGLVSLEVTQQASLPPRKTYSLTEAGRAALGAWVRSRPELPQLRNAFLVQLAWADQLAPAELDGLLAAYEEEVRMQLLMCEEQARRGAVDPARTARERLLWRRIADNWIGAYRTELEWAQGLRAELAASGEGR